eukprot:2535367-Rhodomonas_salina.2
MPLLIGTTTAESRTSTDFVKRGEIKREAGAGASESCDLEESGDEDSLDDVSCKRLTLVELECEDVREKLEKKLTEVIEEKIKS